MDRLAIPLKRKPRQVKEACVEGILDLIERKCEVPRIVIERHLHLKSRSKDDKTDLPWIPPTHAKQEPTGSLQDHLR